MMVVIFSLFSRCSSVSQNTTGASLRQILFRCVHLPAEIGNPPKSRVLVVEESRL
jgi:hypothetical protein